MTEPPGTGTTARMTLSMVALDAPDPPGLARFYAALLGWGVEEESPAWVVLRAPEGGTALAFQREPEHVRPVWPSDAAHQQMQLHLDVAVDDLEGAVRHAVASGAVLAEHQPQERVRVLLDPVGHPFCLYLP